ncbi:MAG: VWA domain-containing protein [Chitinophagales bacterium]
MFRFEHKEYLYLLLLLVPVVLLFFYSLLAQRRKLERFGNLVLVNRLLSGFSRQREWIKLLLPSLALIFLVLAIAGPQIGTKQEKVKRSGIDIVIALDVSRSMLAEDVAPSRLLRAKNFINNFMAQCHNDRIAMIIFAGRSYLQMPLTVDYSAARLYLKTINTESVPTQGTAIAEAVDLAKESFAKGDNKSKALLIISDGEDNEEGAEQAIAEAAKEGVKVFTLAVGTDKGAPIPLANGDFKRDENNAIVLSRVNFDAMKNYASKGNGKAFVLGSGKEEIDAIFKEFGRIGTKDFEEMVFTDYDDKFQYFLAVAGILLLLDFFIGFRSRQIFKKLKLGRS